MATLKELKEKLTGAKNDKVKAVLQKKIDQMEAESKQAKKKALIDKTYQYVDKYLEFCDEKRTPYVFFLKNKTGGIEQIKSFVLNRILNTPNKTMGSAIMDLEMQLDPVYEDY